jgi:TusA-related sulfurtransferase
MIFRYDASQEKCPLPLVNLRLLLKKMRDDDTCIINIKDSGSIDDIPKLLIKLGYRHTVIESDENIVEITIFNKKK